jgi:hypothetical protein
VEVGVGERLGPLGPERCIERLYTERKEKYVSVIKPSGIRHVDDDDNEVSRTLWS